MKFNFSILLFVVLSFSACKQRNPTIDNDSEIDTTVVSEGTPDSIKKEASSVTLPVELKQVFNDWLQNEIKKGNLLSDGDCPTQGTEEYNKFIEKADFYNDEGAIVGGKDIPKHRYHVTGNSLSKVLDYDFNLDGILDKLVVFDFFDCAASGISYPGDLEASILFVSKEGKFVYDNTIIDKFYKSVNNSNGNKYKKDALAYIIIEDIKNGSIVGKYESWSSSENAGTNFSQFRGNFSYDITKNTTTISNEEKIKYSE